MERPLFPRETLDDISIKLDEIATNTNDLNVGSDLSVAHLGSIEALLTQIEDHLDPRT
jgi:hypothetical protein